jgi:hypothetical protein
MREFQLPALEVARYWCIPNSPNTWPVVGEVPGEDLQDGPGPTGLARADIAILAARAALTMNAYQAQRPYARQQRFRADGVRTTGSLSSCQQLLHGRS